MRKLVLALFLVAFVGCTVSSAVAQRSAGTTTITYVMPAGVDPVLVPFTAFGVPFGGIQGADLAPGGGGGVNLLSRIPEGTANADIWQVLMRFTYPGNIVVNTSVDPQFGGVDAWNAYPTRNGDNWAILFSADRAPGSRIPLPISEPGFFALLTATNPDDPANSHLKNITFTATRGATAGSNLSVTATADRSTLWPPNNKTVPVNISGRVTGGSPPYVSAFYFVFDEYGQLSGGPFLLNSSQFDPILGSFSFKVPLLASRNGTDKDGRQYFITVCATDSAGHQSCVSVEVIVPHNQG
jgi:uncharacterized protein YggT (Ycf19 family)